MRFRVRFEVLGIMVANSEKEAIEYASKLAQQNRWIFKGVMEDVPEQDGSFNYPPEVQKLIEEERRWKER